MCIRDRSSSSSRCDAADEGRRERERVRARASGRRHDTVSFVFVNTNRRIVSDSRASSERRSRGSKSRRGRSRSRVSLVRDVFARPVGRRRSLRRATRRNAPLSSIRSTSRSFEGTNRRSDDVRERWTEAPEFVWGYEREERSACHPASASRLRRRSPLPSFASVVHAVDVILSLIHI